MSSFIDRLANLKDQVLVEYLLPEAFVLRLVSSEHLCDVKIRSAARLVLAR